MSPTAGKHQDSSAVARFAGSGASGVLELLLFHPVDTVAKRLMTNETKIFGSGSPVANMNNAIFKVCMSPHGHGVNCREFTLNFNIPYFGDTNTFHYITNRNMPMLAL